MKTRQALTNGTAKRYRTAGRKGKTKILDEFVEHTGYCRKYALHVLANWEKLHVARLDGQQITLKAGKPKKRKKHTGKPVYTAPDIEALKAVWDFFWQPCGKLTAPLLRTQMDFLVSVPEFGITDAIRADLLKISPATIDRKLREEKKRLAVRGISGTKPGSLLRGQVQVRTHYPFNEREPGFFETDTVHNCGDHDSGEYNLSLTATDVYSGWVELRALLNKAHKWVLEGWTDIADTLPFPLLGIDSDNGGEFINKDLIAWCKQRAVQFTRSRPYKKNDNCHVEQKNNTCVREYVGYYRFTTQEERDALAAVYRALCPLLNYFMPSMKLVDKTRVGAKVRKVYDKPMSPYQRLMGYPQLPEEVRAELVRRYRSYNPVALQREVNAAIKALIAIHTQQAQTVSPVPAVQVS
jgi:hypothetical protein